MRRDVRLNILGAVADKPTALNVRASVALLALPFDGANGTLAYVSVLFRS
jgi:hypothetical protein